MQGGFITFIIFSIFLIIHSVLPELKVSGEVTDPDGNSLGGFTVKVVGKTI